MIYQLEKGENGTMHLQGYAEFKSPVSIKKAQSALQDYQHVVHLEPRRGSREQARDYCQKEDTRMAGPWETGDFSEGAVGVMDLDSVLAMEPREFVVTDRVVGVTQTWRRIGNTNVFEWLH